MSETPSIISTFDKRRVAIEALCDIRSVDKYLRGGRIGDMLRIRVEAALRKLGFEHAIQVAA